MTSISLHQLSKEQINIAVNLYRFTLWANTLRIQFENCLARDRKELERRFQAKELILDTTAIEADMYIHLWFGILYVVVEGWSQLQLKQNQPPKIRKLLKSDFKDLLRKFRNATFHPADFDDPSIQNLAVTGQESILWARELTLEFKSFFESVLSFYRVRLFV